MKFAVLQLDVDKYIDELVGVVKDVNCDIYMDTNMLCWFYKLNKTARSQLFSWLDELSKYKRLFVPAWAANEYNKHLIKDNQDIFSPFKKTAASINNALNQLLEFAHLLVDDDFVKSTSYASGDQMIESIRSRKDALETEIKALKKTSSKDVVHNEINSLLSDVILRTDIFTSLESVLDSAEGRFDHGLPPGFEDSDKKNNRFGDLVLWREIVTHAKSRVANNPSTRVLIISNDRKSDWVYKPQKIIIKGRTSSNDGPSRFYYLPSPQLANEIRCRSKIHDFYVVDIYLLVEVLYKMNSSRFGSLAQATQIISKIEVLEDEQVKEAATDSMSDASTADVGSPQFEIEQPVVAAPAPEQQAGEAVDIFSFSEDAEADSRYVVYDELPLDSIIIDLKSHNWYKQNPAVERIITTILGLPMSQDKNTLFVLGRNLLQAADGGAFSAKDFILHLRRNLNSIDTSSALHIFCGILFEQFFNSLGNLRKYPLYNPFTSVLDLSRSDDYASACTYINNKLDEAQAFTLFRPGQPPAMIVINAVIDVDKSSQDAAFLVNLTLNDFAILTPVDDPFDHDFYCVSRGVDNARMSKEDIVLEISNAYCLPLSYLQVYCATHDYFIVPQNLVFKKLSTD